MMVENESDPTRAGNAGHGGADALGRRGFMGKLALGSLSAALGAEIVFGGKMPAGLIPIALAQGGAAAIPGKEGLSMLNDRPLVAETPAHLLDDEVTPARHLFVRNNGLPPAVEPGAGEDWTLEIGGESCERPATFTLAELKSRFEHQHLQLVLECAGNGRSEFNPPATGNQWTTGGVGCPRWTGVRLRDVLLECGVRDSAVYLGYYGADAHLSGDPARSPISRGVPIAKAMEPESLLVFAMNGEDIPYLNGHPLRLMFGGWAASTCGKWVKKIVLRDREHDGEKMTGHSYRMPRYPVAPGTKVPEEDMAVIEALPVKSLVTFPQSGISHPRGRALELRGQAWTGEGGVERVDVSIDFGATWRRALLKPPVNRYAWQRWTAEVELPRPGYYEVWARATDDRGRSQPMVLPGWNPEGYYNNSCHRIAVQAV
jgi:DMSO/TMAO reductase YedYZ molybdopterin-dependent catalytic subunit